MRTRGLTTLTLSERGTIRGGAFMAARDAASLLITWLMHSGRVPSLAVR